MWEIAKRSGIEQMAPDDTMTAGHNGGRRSTRRTGRNGVTAESEIIST